MSAFSLTFEVFQNNILDILMFSGVDASIERPERAASFVQVRPHLNFLNHQKMDVFDRANMP